METPLPVAVALVLVLDGVTVVLDAALEKLEGALVVVGRTVGTLRVGMRVELGTTGVQVEEMTEEVVEGTATASTRLVGALMGAVW